MTRPVHARYQNFRGLNDRRHLSALAPGEFADCMNVDLSRRACEKRLGFERLAGPLKNGSLKLDGINDYLRIKNQTGYNVATSAGIYFGIGVIFNRRPTSTVTIASSGFGAAGSLHWDLRYDPTGGTGSLGAFIARVRDTVGPATVTMTLDYGNADDSIVGQPRYIEAGFANGASALVMWTTAGVSTTVVGTSVNTFNWSSGQDIFIGVGTTTTNTIGTDFAPITTYEVRLGTMTQYNAGLGCTTTNQYYKRELNAADAARCLGYWKLNDGGLEPRCADSTTTANHALIVNNPASWLLKSDDSKVMGQSAVSFFGGNSWIDLSDTDGTKVAATFAPTAPNIANWTVRLVLILPTLPPGYTTWPDGVVFWAGTDTTLPSPLALVIVSDRLTAYYNDNGTLRTAAMSGAQPTMTSLAGKRMRVAVYRNGTGTGQVSLGLAVDNNDGTVTTYFAGVACTGAAPTVVSSNWAFGRHVTNFTTARLGTTTAFHTDGSFIGTVDDVQIIHSNSLTIPIGLAAAFGSVMFATQCFQEIADWNGVFGAQIHTTHLYLKLNDGGGNVLKTLGTNTTDTFGGGWRCYLRPEIDSGSTWDAGVVEPFLPVRGSLVFPYDKFLSDGTKSRALLVASGTTLSSYTDAKGLEVVGALRGAADAYTAAQYGSKVILAGAPGRRPVVYDGGEIRNLGIRAPNAAPVVTVSNTGPGAFVAGQYYLYVTFRSTQGGVPIESNPSPGTLVTFAAPNDTIDSIDLPVSSDPQVNQRRIYMTSVAVTATDGATAYLVATVDDNTTAAYTTDIVGPVSTSAVTLEYFAHQEAPDATLVGQMLDYTLLGGNQLLPTRLFYSSVGVPDYWDTSVTGDYLDLDLDSGEPIVAISPLLDRAIVDVSDGKWGIYATGDTDRPLGKTRINNTHGAVGAQASIVVNNQQWYIGESDIHVSDGYKETNVSSPDEPPATAPVYIQQLGKTSIQDMFRTKIDWTGRSRFCVVEHRARSQIWFGIRMSDGPTWLTGTNTHALIYDTIQGFWSRYDIPLDCGTLAEIESERAEPVGVVQGWLVRFDYDSGDGAAASSVLTITGGAAASTGTTLTFGGTPFSGLDYRHLRCFVHRASAPDVIEHRIVGVPTTSSLLIESNDTTLAISDRVIVAAAPYYFDFAVQFGDPLSTKALLGATFGTEAVSASSVLRLQHKNDLLSRPATLTGFTSRNLTLSSSIISRWLALGGLGVSFYVRVSETGYAAGAATGVFPGGKSFRIHGIAFEGRETHARSRS